MKEKKKVLVLSDHALSTSGVGTQTRHLINGLLEKDCWTFRQFGAALKHSDYETIVVNEDFIIKPIDGFGNRELIRIALATEKPDILLIFTDPRFFIWLFEMEDEIHQICPIAWWHVWDNLPQPNFNDVLYESTDSINCHSYLTYEMCKEKFPDKTNFIPHAVPEELFHPIDESEISKFKRQVLGEEKKDSFVGIWVNRNAKRKRSSDVLVAWKMFLDKINEKYGKSDACLILHTDPLDHEGPNLFSVADELGVSDSIFFSRDRLDFEKMNVLYNISDFCMNISYAEGFGLSTLESMQTGTPILAVKTGGLTRQVVDHRDGTENGIALPVEFKTLVGSQQVPFIYEDYVSCETVSEGILSLYEMPDDERQILKRKVRDYAKSQFNLQDTIDSWHDNMTTLIENWNTDRKNWSCKTI